MAVLDVSVPQAPARRSLAELVMREKKRTTRRRVLAWVLLAVVPRICGRCRRGRLHGATRSRPSASSDSASEAMEGRRIE